MSTYTSAAPLTMVRTVDGGYRNVYENEEIAGEAVLPDDLKRLVRKGFLVKKAEPEPEPDQFDPAKGGGVKETLEYVGDDKSKATALLELEEAKGDKARASLVEKLEAIATEPA